MRSGVTCRFDPVHHRFHQRGGLAGARSGQYQQRAAGVVHDGLLGGVQDRRDGRRFRGADQAVHGGASCLGGEGLAYAVLDQTLLTTHRHLALPRP